MSQVRRGALHMVTRSGTALAASSSRRSRVLVSTSVLTLTSASLTLASAVALPYGEAHGGADERAHWACARPSSGVFNLTSTTHTPVHGVLSRARARLCLAGRGIGPILVRVF